MILNKLPEEIARDRIWQPNVILDKLPEGTTSEVNSTHSQPGIDTKPDSTHSQFGIDTKPDSVTEFYSGLAGFLDAVH